MPFGIAAAGIGAAGALGGAAMQSSAVSGASKAAAQDQRIAFLMADQYNKPYRDFGTTALNQLAGLTGLGPDDTATAMSRFQVDPGYQFARDQGLRGVDAGAASRGLLNSGATIKAEEGFASGLASQQFENYVNRLFKLTAMGQSAANQQATDALNTGTNLSNIAASQGAADANIYGNTAKGLGTIANDLFKNPDFQSSLRGLFSGSGSIYGDLGSNVNYASQVAGPTVSNMFGLPNTSSFGY
jgi:hypothetical protein